MLPALYYILYTITLKMFRLKYISCMILTELYAKETIAKELFFP